MILDQIFSDNVHLTPLGELFVGAYTFGEIFNQNPGGHPIPEGISETTGMALLTLAWELVMEYNNYNNLGTGKNHSMSACRTHIAENVCEYYWAGIFNQPQFVASCQAHFGQEVDGNPFRSNDPEWINWPTPN